MTDTQSLIPAPARYSDGRFGQGNPGRRPGSRGRAANRVATAFLEDSLVHKSRLMMAMRVSPHANRAPLMKVLATSVATEGASGSAGWTDAEVAQGVAGAGAALDRANAGCGRADRAEIGAAVEGTGPVGQGDSPYLTVN